MVANRMRKAVAYISSSISSGLIFSDASNSLRVLRSIFFLRDVGKGEWRNNYIFPAIENPSNLNRIPFCLILVEFMTPSFSPFDKIKFFLMFLLVPIVNLSLTMSYERIEEEETEEEEYELY